MKKLCMLIALAVVLSCCVFALAACGGDDDTSSSKSASSAGTSSAEASTSSAASSEALSSADTSSEETSSEDTSSEESSADTSIPSNPDAVAGDGSNLALNKTYTISELFRQGGAEAGWGYDENAAIAYPDEENVTLTDGQLASEENGYTDAAWMGFGASDPHYVETGYAWATIDLGQSYQLAKLVLHVGGAGLGSGISAPAGVEFLVSEDGETFYSVGSVTPEDSETAFSIAATLECPEGVTGRYVQVRLTAANWMFVSEFEAY